MAAEDEAGEGFDATGFGETGSTAPFTPGGGADGTAPFLSDGSEKGLLGKGTWEIGGITDGLKVEPIAGLVDGLAGGTKVLTVGFTVGLTTGLTVEPIAGLAVEKLEGVE